MTEKKELSRKELAELPYGTPVHGFYDFNEGYADGKGGTVDAYGEPRSLAPVYLRSDTHDVGREVIYNNVKWLKEARRANALERQLKKLGDIRGRLSIVSDRLVVAERRAQDARAEVDALRTELVALDGPPEEQDGKNG